MSKNITIQEGGLAKQLTANKLKTNLVGGGACLWVPEDETVVGTKNITGNGTYKASDDGYYGYSEVTVSIPNVGTATGTDGDGDEAVAHTDPETGDLVTDKVPSSIEVITPPTNPYGIYTNGQAITTNGMVVKAYLKSGGEYGNVPIGEVILNPTTAIYDPNTDTKEYQSELDISPWPNPIAGSPSRVELYDEQGRVTERYIFQAEVAACNDEFNTNIIAASSHSGNIGVHQGVSYDASGNEKISWQSNVSAANVYTYNGKTVYFASIAYNKNRQTNLVQNIATGGGSVISASKLAAWTMVYGNATVPGSRQQITVSWPRPIDGKVLETTFEILVAPPIYGDSEN